MARAWVHVSCVVVVALCSICLAPTAATGQTARGAAVCDADDFVGIAITPSAVVMTTAARPAAGDMAVPYLFGPRGKQWRFRTIPIAPEAGPLTTFEMRRSGSTAVVAFNGAQAFEADLTRTIYALGTDAARRRLADDRRLAEACLMPAGRLQNFDKQVAAYLKGQTPSWKFFSIDADGQSYAPTLELSRQEEILPEQFEIWNWLAEEPYKSLLARMVGPDSSAKQVTAALRSTYRRFRERSGPRPATVYFSRRSYPGSWLFEFWFYYPFDEGGLDRHLHDSEHLFVEVDKLGGSVRRVVGAGHGVFAPNSEFTTLREGVPEFDLPLSVLVEQGKHATAPDIDKDGRFVPGIDANLYRDAGKVWGVRDATGVTDSAFRAFESSMSGARSERNALTPLDPSTHGTASDAPKCDDDRPSCYLLIELVDSKVTARCSQATAECAKSQILLNGDYTVPHAVLKEGYYPVVQFIIGSAWTPTKRDQCPCETPEEDRAIELSSRLVLGAAVEISSIPLGGGRRIPAAGRLAAELLLDMTPTSPDPAKSGRFDGFALRYERTATNLSGLYAGFTHDTDELDQSRKLVPGLPDPANWINAGLFFEIPLRSRLLLAARAGGAYSNTFGLAKEIRVSMGLAFGTPNRRFGIARRTPNPFSR